MKIVVPFDELPDGAFVRLPTILSLLPIGRSTWYAKVSSGVYPKGYEVGPRTTAWKVKDVRELLASVDIVKEVGDA